MIAVERWSPVDALTLKPNALAAATETARNLVLTAGPGAGKTEMLAQRADFLLRTGVCRYPLRIPEDPATHSDNIRPPVPGYPATCDALP